MKYANLLSLVVVTALFETSCSDPVAQQRSQARQQAVAADLQSAQKWESQRPPSVAADLREVGVIEREYGAKLRSDVGWYDYMYQREVREWNDRQGDRMRGIQKEFAGDPKAAHDTAVQFLD